MAKRPKIAAIVLAAGRSTRMGEINKLLADWNGKRLIVRTLENVAAANLNEIWIVTGHQSEDLKKAIAGFDVQFVHNADYTSGLASSLKAGIAALDSEIDGALILLGDMPLVEVDVINRMIEAFDQTSDICVPVFEGRQGNPVLWGRDYFMDIQMLSGDRGAKGLLSKHHDHAKIIDVDTSSVLRDFDKPTDFV